MASLGELEGRAQSSLSCFRESNSLCDIDEAIQAQKQAIVHTQKDDSDSLVARLQSLASMCSLRFASSNRILDIRQATSSLQAAKTIYQVECAPEKQELLVELDQSLAEGLTKLGIALIRRRRKVDDLHQAVKALQDAVTLTPPVEPDAQKLSYRLGVLGMGLKRRFEQGRDPRDIERSIELQRRACGLDGQAQSVSTSDRAIGLYNLAASLSVRYQAQENQDDLDEAIQYLRTATEISTPTDSLLPSYFFQLGGNLKLLFEASRDAQHIDEAIEVLSRGISLSSESNTMSYLPNLVTLGEAYAQRFERFGESLPADIDEAISCIRRALERTSPDDPEIVIRLCSLGKALSSRFQRLGGMEYLQDAVVSHRNAVELAPQGHPHLPHLLNSLATTLGIRFQITKAMEDLDEAISSSRRAVALTSSDNPYFLPYLDNLGISLDIRYTISRDVEDMQQAMMAFRKVISMTPPSNPDYASYMSHAAMTFTSLYHASNNKHYLDQAIVIYERALASIDDEDHRLYVILYNCAMTLGQRYDDYGMMDDLHSQISALRRAVDLVHPSNPDTSDCHGKLGNALMKRYEEEADIEDIRHATAQYRLGALSPAGSPVSRITLARVWANHAEILNPRSSLEGHGVAVELIALVSGLERTIEDRHESLTRLGTYDIVGAAALSALEFGEVEKALEWLEQGRGLVWRQVSELRTPIQELELKHRALAQRVLMLSRELEALHASHVPDVEQDQRRSLKLSGDSEVHRRVKLVREWEDVVGEVRRIRGFEAFLRPSSISQTLSNLPTHGYTVVISAHNRRCTAIVISPGKAQPEAIRLSALTVAEGEMMYQKLQRCLRASGMRDTSTTALDGDFNNPARALRKFVKKAADESIESVLKELWDRVAKPIVEHLQLKPSANPTEKARIWWCLTGPFAFLPIHAAGCYGKSACLGDSLADYAISSYTPTLTTLAQRHRHRTTASSLSSTGGLLVVSVSKSPGLPEIPGTRAEALTIQKTAHQVSQCSTHIIHLDDSAALVETVAAKITSSDFPVVHFACHAKQDSDSPIQSGFYLADGKLSLADIIRRRQREAGTDTSKDLAFLSACETGTGKEALSEEGVHLVAGMLAAGYKGVVGTMWSIPDAHAPYIAEEFYKTYLGKEGGDSAYALHCAIGKLRIKLGDSKDACSAWVPFVHFGL